MAGRVDGERALPVAQGEINHRRRVSDAGVGDDHVHAPVGEDGLLEGGPDRGLAGHVHCEPERSPAAHLGRDLVGNLTRTRSIEVSDHDVGALRGQAPGHGLSETSRPAGDKGDPTRHLALGRGQGELVQLERPVLDVECVPRAQRDIPAERAGIAHHVDRVVVDVVHDAGRAPILARREHSETGDQHHAGQRIGEFRPLEPMGLEVARVLFGVALHVAFDGSAHGLGVVGSLGVHKAGHPLREDGVVRRGRPYLGQRSGVGRGDELVDTRGVSSKARTTRRSRLSRPRRRGAMATAAARRAEGSGRGTVGGPKTCRPRRRAAIASSAREISSMVASYASRTVAPHVMVPWRSRRSARASGRAAMASATSLEMRKPGRR